MSKSIKVTDEVYNLIKDAQGVRETNGDVVEKCILVAKFVQLSFGIQSVRELTVELARKRYAEKASAH